MSRALTRVLYLTTLAVAVGLFSGCAPLNLRGERFPESQQRMLSGARPPDEGDNKPWALTTKGQQIEENFGKR